MSNRGFYQGQMPPGGINQPPTQGNTQFFQTGPNPSHPPQAGFGPVGQNFGSAPPPSYGGQQSAGFGQPPAGYGNQFSQPGKWHLFFHHHSQL